jgi:hypothetical protein
MRQVFVIAFILLSIFIGRKVVFLLEEAQASFVENEATIIQ